MAFLCRIDKSLRIWGHATDLVAQHDLCTRAFPASVARRGHHEFTGGIDMQSRDDARAVTRHDEERDGAARVFRVAEVVEAEDIIGRAGSSSISLPFFSVLAEEGYRNLPDQMPSVGHSPNSTHGTTTSREFKRALGLGGAEALV